MLYPVKCVVPLHDRLENLRNNRTSGAVDLAIEALDLARDWIDSGWPVPELAAELESMHPAIATVANVARLLREPAEDLPAQIQEIRKLLVEGNRRIADNLRPLIPPASKVITLSNSSTVREALLALGVDTVYVLESRPGGEGAEMADALRERSRSPGGILLIPDSSIGNVVPVVDCALVGIDTYDRTGAILHKVGTLPLALCCWQFGKPFYAAGHSFKFADREFQGLPEPDKPLAGQLFDSTPATLITKLVTEQ